MSESPGSVSGPAMSPGDVFQEMYGVCEWIGVLHDIMKLQPPDQRLADDVTWSPNGVVDNFLKQGDCQLAVPPKGGPVTNGDVARILGGLHTVSIDAMKHVEDLKQILVSLQTVSADAGKWID